MTENEIARIVFAKGLEVHREMGPGLLESAYEECLEYELTKSGAFVERQKSIPITYKGNTLERGFIVDMVINDKLLLELKSVRNIDPIHVAQTLTYLKLTNLCLGLLINFNVELFKNGVRRVVNGL
ncbi:MAG: GxxExxY protein [Fluviicola sp.]